MNINFSLLVPEYVLVGVAFAVLAADLLLPRQHRFHLSWLAAGGLVVSAVVVLVQRWDTAEHLYGGLFIADRFGLFFFVFLTVLTAVIVLISHDYVRQHIRQPGEFYALMVFAAVGMVGMAQAGELLTAYVALELLSFSLYVLVAFRREDAHGNEAGVKYIVLGAFSSALLLYGISMVWGATGTTYYAGISEHLALNAGNLDSTLILGLALIFAGLGFKVAAAPFHMWAPDTYQGAPTPVTAFLAVASKAAAFALILRLFTQGLLPALAEWQVLVAVLAVATMVIGNLVAIVQTNIKRMLAYSSVGQVGFLLLGVAALGHVEGGVVIPVTLASDAVMLHLVGYAFANLAAFATVIVVYNHIGTDELSGYSGLAKRSPHLSLVMAVALFSLAGLPFFVGFITKFYLFTAAAESGLLWLAGVAMAASVVSLYYYLMIVKRMFIDDVPESDITSALIGIPRLSWLLLSALLIGTVLLGVYPGPLADAVGAASSAIFSGA
ncbi:MAG TPA: NADH-quinone oxidoreductase subunit N [Dehalococcoidia bacterium]|jgi:NADH-quinone oxidoreductase subunit N|nr:NADH-quinone oxidoreductase subunit N [Chloroflexota bacterium]MDP5877326.1 NADH-quinone oxidoreductase subunit N [Dehalococcoidia bacterium]MDP6272908.1 NADH-quinone oxidoreductase subunit N [Dehalococcoidia bacterium]MDP7159987.1 NADH-quinone oxidoreductase subunit N [Dehalococcoidia bacterium]MDP7212397.1 NADH-quinone oxidoreductase subunit N [Dehalococcoidia bacterium]|tara:strand:- start:519 stop:2006 length:1488 start_codon:yes stop_codon:yes gene_type:complete